MTQDSSTLDNFRLSIIALHDLIVHGFSREGS